MPSLRIYWQMSPRPGERAQPSTGLQGGRTGPGHKPCPAGKEDGVLEQSSQQAWFSPNPQTVAAVRDFLRDCLPTVDPDLVHTATLLASEIAANVVEHAQTDYEVRVRQSEQVLRVEIADGSSVIPAVRDLAVDADRGRGLQLLAGLADAWGVEEAPTGKDVWFELVLEAQSEERRRAGA